MFTWNTNRPQTLFGLTIESSSGSATDSATFISASNYTSRSFFATYEGTTSGPSVTRMNSLRTTLLDIVDSPVSATYMITAQTDRTENYTATSQILRSTFIVNYGGVPSTGTKTIYTNKTVSPTNDGVLSVTTTTRATAFANSTFSTITQEITTTGNVDSSTSVYSVVDSELIVTSVSTTVKSSATTSLESYEFDTFTVEVPITSARTITIDALSGTLVTVLELNEIGTVYRVNSFEKLFSLKAENTGYDIKLLTDIADTFSQATFWPLGTLLPVQVASFTTPSPSSSASTIGSRFTVTLTGIVGTSGIKTTTSGENLPKGERTSNVVTGTTQETTTVGFTGLNTSSFSYRSTNTVNFVYMEYKVQTSKIVVNHTTHTVNFTTATNLAQSTLDREVSISIIAYATSSGTDFAETVASGRTVSAVASVSLGGQIFSPQPITELFRAQSLGLFKIPSGIEASDDAGTNINFPSTIYYPFSLYSSAHIGVQVPIPLNTSAVTGVTTWRYDWSSNSTLLWTSSSDTTTSATGSGVPNLVSVGGDLDYLSRVGAVAGGFPYRTAIDGTAMIKPGGYISVVYDSDGESTLESTIVDVWGREDAAHETVRVISGIYAYRFITANTLAHSIETFPRVITYQPAPDL